ncbi:hypothetical protein D9C73_007140 [Collichthys lucidus]|uniref:Uncharacterized protein n=1 Tax=Collichthys lucidus TaxID=240159 RepID=A0A4V6ANJ5_COLLU|nr:hypothetical protein D9C73_007140 [Collichthys lucidus]
MCQTLVCVRYPSSETDKPIGLIFQWLQCLDCSDFLSLTIVSRRKLNEPLRTDLRADVCRLFCRPPQVTGCLSGRCGRSICASAETLPVSNHTWSEMNHTDVTVWLRLSGSEPARLQGEQKRARMSSSSSSVGSQLGVSFCKKQETSFQPLREDGSRLGPPCCQHVHAGCRMDAKRMVDDGRWSPSLAVLIQDNNTPPGLRTEVEKHQVWIHGALGCLSSATLCPLSEAFSAFLRHRPKTAGEQQESRYHLSPVRGGEPATTAGGTQQPHIRLQVSFQSQPVAHLAAHTDGAHSSCMDGASNGLPLMTFMVFGWIPIGSNLTRALYYHRCADTAFYASRGAGTKGNLETVNRRSTGAVKTGSAADMFQRRSTRR